MRFTSVCAASIIAATSSMAQEQPNTILVMDGSGSMWGQIDGVAKITIAQDVIGDLLNTIPNDQGLGLTVYGHRERGNCTDIETVVAPAPGTADAIRDAVAGIKPLGKTPMTDAVIAAAQALRYTEDKATVILVSDGVETCNPDPCAAARLLEEAGIDFTVHVVGFDVGSDPEALAQMQCIADETGGQFLTADDAGQLAEALTTVAAAPEPEPELTPVTFTAVEGENGPVISDPILWSVTGDFGTISQDQSGNPYMAEIEQGSYTASAYRLSTETALEQQFVAIGDSAEVTIVFPVPVEEATIVAPASAPLGSTIQVDWDGPNDPGDFIGIGPTDAKGAEQWRNFEYTESGSPVDLLIPPVEGTHLISYFKAGTYDVIGTVEIDVTPIEVSVSSVETASVGNTISVVWVGPNYEGDFVGMGAVGKTGANMWESFTYTDAGSPAELLVPTTPGDYVVQYFIGQDNTPMASTTITVTEVSASIIAASEAIAGTTIPVEWTGPNLEGDYIGIGKAGLTNSNAWENYQYTKDGTPVQLLIPAEPGDYEIKYFIGQDRSFIASVPITVTDVVASLTAPFAATAGSEITVEWTGPNYERDYIGIGKAGLTNANAWEQYTYTEDGSPMTIRVPATPGDYEIKYFLSQDRTSLVSVPLTVNPVKATLSAPTEVRAGDTFEVSWTGPNYENDYVGIGEADARGANLWANYSYTADGDPLVLTAPVTTGDHVVSYFMSLDRTEVAQIPIQVIPLEVQLQAASSATAGDEIIVAWDGPDYENDYIGVGKVDASGASAWQTYSYTADGNPAVITLPEEPGDYLITYFLSQDRKAVMSIPLVIK